MKTHLKRLAAPKTWPILRKNFRFMAKPKPGPHSLERGLSLSALLKDTLKYAATTKEVKKLMCANKIIVDGKQRKNFRFPIGIFDTIEFPSLNEHYRVVLNRGGRIELAKIPKEEASTKPCKVIGKTMVNGKLQLNLYDGKNIIADKNVCNSGDTVLLDLPGNKISKHLKLEKKSLVFLTGGKHVGEMGSVEDIRSDKIVYKDEKGNLIETSKKHAFVIGENKPLITIKPR
ncbi:30S ribosomal protein S4e [Candidatus Woesearchaeota archaeon]|nr:30S ribosomal protein S4e [Candidatus Woesearchaeota archaeon]